MRFLMIAFVFLSVSELKGQTSYFNRTYEMGGYDFAESILVLDDGFLTIGSSSDYNLTDQKVIILKTDFEGDTLWTRKVGLMNFNLEGHSLIATIDGNYLIAGGAIRDRIGSVEFYLYKF